MKIWGGSIIFEGRTVFRGLDIFWFWEFGFGDWVNCCRGHQVAGSFGLGGQGSSQNPGAREPKRLLLAGWVVSWFWEGFGQSIRQRLERIAGGTTR